jgi:O-antigen/teichoic acid export membrane protein
MMSGLIAGTAAAVILQLWFLREHVDVPRFVPSADLVRNSAELGMKGYLANLSQFFTYRLDTFVVSYYVGSFALGLYALAYTTGELLWYVPTTLSTVLLPITASSSTEEANARTAQLCRLVSLLGLVGGSALALAGPFILPQTLGTSFTSSVPLLWALLPGIVLFMVERLISADLTGRGYLQYATYGSLIAFVGTLILDLLFIPHFGVMAAAVNSSVIYIIETLYLLNRFHAVSGVRYRDLFLLKIEDVSVLKQLVFNRPCAWLSARLREAA